MEENLFQFINLIILFFVILLLLFWRDEAESHSESSELHARTRYSIAEKIKAELKK